MSSQVFDTDIFKIITLFSASPGSRFSRKEIKEKTLLNNVPLDKALIRLAYSKILLHEKGFYFLNIYSEASKLLIQLAKKEFIELKEIPLPVYFLLLDMAYYLSSQKGCDVYLFGSYSKLVYKESSDVDVAVVSDRIDKKFARKVAIALEKIYKKKIEIHFFERKFYKNKSDPLVKEILKNGVRIL